MSNKGLLATVMATEITEACRKDDEWGYDFSDGVFGLAFSKLIRNYAGYIDELQQEIIQLKSCQD